MELASTSQVVIRYAQETQFGVVPTTGNHKVLPANSESLTYTIDKTQSEELNPSRGVTDSIPTASSATGSVTVELKASTYDDLIEAGMQGTWDDTAGADFDLTITPTQITASGGLPVLTPGQFFAVGSATSLNKRRLLRVAIAPGSSTPTTITLDPALPALAETITDATLTTSRLRNGTVRRSFYVEKEYADVGSFRGYTGMNVAGFSLNATQGALTTGEFQFLGRAGLKKSNATRLPGTEEVTPERRPMSGMTGAVCAVWIDDEPLAGTYINGISLTLENNLRTQNAMCAADANGVVGAIGIGNGMLGISGSLTIYFSAEDVLYDEFIENRNVKLAFTAFDTEGNGYVFTLPKVNLGTNDAPASGNNQDVQATINFTALQINSADADLQGAVMLIDRVSFAAV